MAVIRGTVPALCCFPSPKRCLGVARGEHQPRPRQGAEQSSYRPYNVLGHNHSLLSARYSSLWLWPEDTSGVVASSVGSPLEPLTRLAKTPIRQAPAAKESAS